MSINLGKTGQCRAFWSDRRNLHFRGIPTVEAATGCTSLLLALQSMTVLV